MHYGHECTAHSLNRQGSTAFGSEINSEDLVAGDLSLASLAIRFTVRNLTVEGSETGIFASWNWGTFISHDYQVIYPNEHTLGWTFQDLKLKDCKVGPIGLMNPSTS